MNPLHFAPTSDGSPDSWWDTVVDWLHTTGDTAGKVALTVGVAIVVWIIGRFAIRAATRGIRTGIPRGERRARRLLKKANLPVPERTQEDELEQLRRLQRAQTVGGVMRSGLTVAIVVITAVTVLSQVGIDVGPLIAAAGIVGVALGFGAQSLVKDLLSGMFMLIEDQYGVGDVIDTGEAIGLVEEVGLRSTRLRSLDGVVWFVPNGEIRRIGNMSQLYSRVKIEIRFAFDVDIDAARQALIDAAEMARKDDAIGDEIIGDPEVAGVEDMDYNSVTLRLLMQTKPIMQWAVMRAVRRNLRDIILERKIPLAAPEGALLQPASELPAPTAEANAKPRSGSRTKRRTPPPTK